MVKTHGTNWANPHSVPFWYPSNVRVQCRCWYPNRNGCPYCYCCRPGAISEIVRGHFMEAFIQAGPECYVQVQMQGSRIKDRLMCQDTSYKNVARRPGQPGQAQMQGQTINLYTKAMVQLQEKRLMESFIESNPGDDRKSMKSVGAPVKAINNRMGTTKREIAKGNKLVAVTRHRHWRH